MKNLIRFFIKMDRKTIVFFKDREQYKNNIKPVLFESYDIEDSSITFDNFNSLFSIYMMKTRIFLGILELFPINKDVILEETKKVTNITNNSTIINETIKIWKNIKEMIDENEINITDNISVNYFRKLEPKWYLYKYYIFNGITFREMPIEIEDEKMEDFSGHNSHLIILKNYDNPEESEELNNYRNKESFLKI